VTYNANKFHFVAGSVPSRNPPLHSRLLDNLPAFLAEIDREPRELQRIRQNRYRSLLQLHALQNENLLSGYIAEDEHASHVKCNKSYGCPVCCCSTPSIERIQQAVDKTAPTPTAAHNMQYTQNSFKSCTKKIAIEQATPHL
jgi:hypothetical protein